MSNIFQARMQKIKVQPGLITHNFSVFPLFQNVGNTENETKSNLIVLTCFRYASQQHIRILYFVGWATNKVMNYAECAKIP